MNMKKVYSPGILNELVNKSIQFHNALLEKEKVNEDIISEILSETNNEKRQIIRKNYKQLFKHPIQDDINEKLTENSYLLHDIAINMFDTPYEFEARELKKALSTTIGGDEDIIIEIFASRPKSHLNMIDLAYEKFYKISLKEDIKNKLSKEYSHFLLTLMETDRPEEQTITSVTSELKEATSPATKGIILIMAAMALIWMMWNYLRMTISPNAASQDQIRNVIIGFVILILALVFYLSIFGTGGLGLTSDHIESAIKP